MDVNEVIGDGSPKKRGQKGMADAYSEIMERIVKENWKKIQT